MENKCFYNYDKSNKKWISYNTDVLKAQLLSFIITKFPTLYKKFNPKNLDSILILLQRHAFKLGQAKSEANKKGLLLSFRNIVLNCQTQKTFKHKPSYYITHTIQCNYNPKSSILNTPMLDFLTHISNNNKNTLEIIRASLYLIFTNNLTYQVALYIYGPGGTGKSTFSNLITHLLGGSATLTTNLRTLQSRFGLAPLRDKLLLVISELPLTLGSEPQVLKNIIGGDPLTSEEKYKPSVQLLPNAFVLITSNTLWNLVNSSSGMARRFIYLAFSSKPKESNQNLFTLTSDNTAKGTLSLYLPHLINWILAIKPSQLEILSKGGEHATNLISPETLILTNPVKAWILERLVPDKNSSVKFALRGKGSDDTTLFGNFKAWTELLNGEVGTIQANQFSSLLISNLHTMSWKFEKGRSASGYILKGVRLNNSTLIHSQDNAPVITSSDFE